MWMKSAVLQKTFMNKEEKQAGQSCRKSQHKKEKKKKNNPRELVTSDAVLW